jgi:hypothetical protein
MSIQEHNRVSGAPCLVLLAGIQLLQCKWNSFCEFNITSVACAVGPSVTMSSTDFSFQNLVFWNLFEFSAPEITLKLNISHILNPNLIK